MSFRVRKSMNYITAVLHFKRGDNFTFDGYANEIWSLTFVKDLNLHDMYFSVVKSVYFFKSLVEALLSLMINCTQSLRYIWTLAVESDADD